MNGPQDVGGRDGFGPVGPKPDEPIFHAEWEKRALGVTLACGALGHWTLDESRHARESLHPADYYASSYYEIWIKGLEKLLLRHGEITAEELAQGQAKQPGLRPEKRLGADKVAGVLAHGASTERPIGTAPAFSPGDRVRTIRDRIEGHTRLPGYARGRAGVVETVRGAHVFPDANAHGLGERPEWLYAVRFEAEELWGRGGDPTSSVTIDAWESYLEPASD